MVAAGQEPGREAAPLDPERAGHGLVAAHVDERPERAVAERLGRPAGERQRQAAAFPGLAGLGAHQFERIEDPAHRPGAQRGIAVEHGRDRAARHRPHHQPAPGTGIAEIERGGWLGEAGHADACDLPGKRSGPLDLGAQCLHGFGRVEDVFTLQQAGNPGFADGKRPQDEGAVRNRLVAGNADFAAQRAACAGFQRGLGG